MAECHYCGRRFPQLYKLTAEDIQREHLPPAAYQIACGECLDKIRSTSHLIPEYSLRSTIRDFLFVVPLVSGVLFVGSILVSLVRVQGISQIGLFAQWLGFATVMFGTMMVWDRCKNRYGWTHDLRWSLNSRRVSLALGIVLAGIVVAIAASQLPR